MYSLWPLPMICGPRYISRLIDWQSQIIRPILVSSRRSRHRNDIQAAMFPLSIKNKQSLETFLIGLKISILGRWSDFSCPDSRFFSKCLRFNFKQSHPGRWAYFLLFPTSSLAPLKAIPEGFSLHGCSKSCLPSKTLVN